MVHHKGRKKTTDSESGITVGSVAQAAVLDNMARKKNKEVALDFYRFKKHEAQRSGEFAFSIIHVWTKTNYLLPTMFVIINQRSTIMISYVIFEDEI